MERVFHFSNHLINSPSLSFNPCNNTNNNNDDILYFNYPNSIKILLNKPKALNSLNLCMINKIQSLISLSKEKNKKIILLRGEGTKAFCAGGDIRALAESSKSKDLSYCAEFFSKEFHLDCEIAQLKDSNSTTVISLLNGITMGGGVGLSVHSKFIIATETIKFAMPETGIGYFCDVGGSYFLSRLPGKLGTYIGLTGYRLSLPDLLYCGIVTHYCPSSHLNELEKLLLESDGNLNTIQNILSDLCLSYPPPEQISNLKNNRNIIDECFSCDSIEEIIIKLKNINNEWTNKTLKTLSLKSPTSLKLELECIRRGKFLDIHKVLQMEFEVAIRCMKHHDFYEGVRALIIEKDNKPKWNPNELSQVLNTDIFSFFKSNNEFKDYASII